MFDRELTTPCGKDNATISHRAECSSRPRQKRQRIGREARARDASSAIKECGYWPQTLEPVVQTNGTTTPVKQVV
jgi:hypothetical protein